MEDVATGLGVGCADAPDFALMCTDVEGDFLCCISGWL